MANTAFQNPHTIVSASGKHYSPLSRPSTAPEHKVWKPSSTVRHSVQSVDLRRTPSNPRFQNVQPKTDSGWSMRKAEQKHGTMNSARYRRTEPFKRIKSSNVAEIVREGRKDVLLLDLRSAEEFEMCHIKGAYNYPAHMMSRSMYQYTPEILNFKNKEGYIMVLYEHEERLSVSVGTHWYEKGIDNFVVMSGGLAALCRDNSDVIEGNIEPLMSEMTPPHSLAPSPQKPSPARAGHASITRGSTPSRTVHRPASAGIATMASGPLSVPRPAQWSPLKPTSRVSQVPSYQYRDFHENVSYR